MLAHIGSWANVRLQARAARGASICKPLFGGTPAFRESSSLLLKFIIYQMTHEFPRSFVLGFGDADSARDRKEQ